MTYYKILAATESQNARIDIMSQIGESWFDEGVTAKNFIKDANALGDVQDIDLHISSPGGNVDDGIAIFNYLKQHKAKITTYIDGMAASIASVIAMAGDEIIMPLGSLMFIHDPLTWGYGNADDMRKTADMLDKVRDSIIDIYRSKTNMSAQDIADLMSEETTMTAQEAVDWGFATKAETYEAPVLNNFDLKDIKEKVIADAEMQAYKHQISSLKNKLDNANTRIKELEEQPEHVEAKSVIAYCKKHNIEMLATTLIESGVTQKDMEDKVATAGKVKDICAAAGIKDYNNVILNIQDPVKMTQLIIMSFQADEFEINNKLNNGGKTPTINTAEIYASRQQEVK